MKTKKEFSEYEEGDKVLVLTPNARTGNDTWRPGKILKSTTTYFSDHGNAKSFPYYMVDTIGVYYRGIASPSTKAGTNNFYPARTVIGVFDSKDMKEKL